MLTLSDEIMALQSKLDIVQTDVTEYNILHQLRTYKFVAFKFRRNYPRAQKQITALLLPD